LSTVGRGGGVTVEWQNAYVERVIGSIRRECLDLVEANRLVFRWSPAKADVPSLRQQPVICAADH